MKIGSQPALYHLEITMGKEMGLMFADVVTLHYTAWHRAQAQLEAAQTERVENPSPQAVAKWDKADLEEQAARERRNEVLAIMNRLAVLSLETEEYLSNVAV